MINGAVLAIQNLDKNKISNAQVHRRNFIIEEAEEQRQYLSEIDNKLHLAICYEIVDFLCTPSAGYTFHKIFIASLRIVEMVIEPRKINLKNPRERHSIMFAMAGFIAGTRWIEQIQKRLEDTSH